MKFKYLFLFIFNTNIYCNYFYDITIVVSPSLFKHFNNSLDIKDYFSQLLNDVNEMMFVTGIQFNINNILLIEKDCDFLKLNYNSTITIGRFEKFVKKIKPFIKSDHYSLFTVDALNSLGIAAIGGMCRIDGTSVISIQHERIHMSSIYAHELGHSLGVKHDHRNADNGCEELDGFCLMFPYYLLEYQPKKFSTRSIYFIEEWKTISKCHKLQKNKTPVKLLSMSYLNQKYKFIKSKCVKPRRKFLNKQKSNNYFLNYNYV